MSIETRYRMPDTWDHGQEYPKEVLEQAFDMKQRKWTKQPEMPSCWKGVEPEWNSKASCFQNQLFCVYWGCYINPDGWTCRLCRQQSFPFKEEVKRRIREAMEMTEIRDPSHFIMLVEQRILEAVENGDLTEQEAYEVIDETGLEKWQPKKEDQRHEFEGKD